MPVPGGSGPFKVGEFYLQPPTSPTAYHPENLDWMPTGSWQWRTLLAAGRAPFAGIALAFNSAIMAAMDRPWRDIAFDLPSVVASGMTPPNSTIP